MNDIPICMYRDIGVSKRNLSLDIPHHYRGLTVMWCNNKKLLIADCKGFL